MKKIISVFLSTIMIFSMGLGVSASSDTYSDQEVAVALSSSIQDGSFTSALNELSDMPDNVLVPIDDAGILYVSKETIIEFGKAESQADSRVKAAADKTVKITSTFNVKPYGRNPAIAKLTLVGNFTYNFATVQATSAVQSASSLIPDAHVSCNGKYVKPGRSSSDAYVEGYYSVTGSVLIENVFDYYDADITGQIFCGPNPEDDDAYVEWYD